MKIAWTSIAGLTAATLLLGGALFAAAQQTSDPVLARVDGVEIRESDLELAEADIGENLPSTNADARRDALVSYLVDVHLLSKAAETRKIHQAPGFDKKLAFMRRKVLMGSLLDEESKTAASDAEMKKLYEESVKKMAPEQEVRARHILVETEAKAKELLDKIKAGGDFAALAKEHSKDPGGGEGGDLGYFTRNQMVPEFAEAAFKLEKGQLSAPVQSQFGWHVIKVEDKRDKPPPDFDAIKERIGAFLTQRAQVALVTKLRADAKIERLDQPAAPAEQKAK